MTALVILNAALGVMALRIQMLPLYNDAGTIEEKGLLDGGGTLGVELTFFIILTVIPLLGWFFLFMPRNLQKETFYLKAVTKDIAVGVNAKGDLQAGSRLEVKLYSWVWLVLLFLFGIVVYRIWQSYDTNSNIGKRCTKEARENYRNSIDKQDIFQFLPPFLHPCTPYVGTSHGGLFDGEEYVMQFFRLTNYTLIVLVLAMLFSFRATAWNKRRARAPENPKIKVTPKAPAAAPAEARQGILKTAPQSILKTARRSPNKDAAAAAAVKIQAAARGRQVRTPVQPKPAAQPKPAIKPRAKPAAQPRVGKVRFLENGSKPGSPPPPRPPIQPSRLVRLAQNNAQNKQLAERLEKLKPVPR